MRGLSGAILLALLGGCTAIPRSQPPVTAPPPVPVVRATEPPERARFSFEGALQQGGLVIGTAPSGTAALFLDGQPVPLAAGERFLIGFDRDAGPSARLTARLADGRTITEPLTVRPRAWRIERVDIARGPSRPDPTYQRIRAAEVARIEAARAIESPVNGWLQRFAWPATGRISGVFGSQRIYRGEPGAYHSGVDIARPTGTAITAPADGVVVLAADRPFSLEGNLLIVDHGMGLNSAFLHLSRIDVRVGQRVGRGQLLGAIGTTGRSTGPHLHWALKWRDARVDPQLLVPPMEGN
ncbi:M23 family metallopeptidase [Sphingomonas jejuensis]